MLLNMRKMINKKYTLLVFVFVGITFLVCKLYIFPWKQVVNNVRSHDVVNEYSKAVFLRQNDNRKRSKYLYHKTLDNRQFQVDRHLESKNPKPDKFDNGSANVDRDSNIVEAIEYINHSKMNHQKNISHLFQYKIVNGGSAIFNSTELDKESVANVKPIIPHIIHQQWDSVNIPITYKEYIKSILDKHPKWEYWFWKMDDAECLIKNKFHEYLEIFQKYKNKLLKADALRYFILYQYGGVYMDLDVEVFKPLDFWTYAFPAVFPVENYEHSHLLYKKTDTNVLNHVIASKPKHPFFKLLQSKLHLRSNWSDAVTATGPMFVQLILDEYEPKDNNSSVLTIHPKYWLPSWDFRIRTKLIKVCTDKMFFFHLDSFAKSVCANLRKNNYRNENIDKETFLNHHWTHMNFWKPVDKLKNTFKIQDVVPNVKFVSEFIKCEK